MATGGYIEVGGTKKLKSCQVGVGGAHKVKEIWAGIGGTAKRVWTAKTAAGQQAFTASQVWIVPEGIRTVDVFCVGGGSSGQTHTQVSASGYTMNTGTHGGCGGYTATVKNVAVAPGQQISVTVGAGGVAVASSTAGTYTTGADTECLTCLAKGGGQTQFSTGEWSSGWFGGSGGGRYGGYYTSYEDGDWKGDAGNGGSDGGNGISNRPGYGAGYGQRSTTKAFGESSGILYAGGGGGGGCHITWFGSGNQEAYNYGTGGSGGGGRGGWYGAGTAGTAGTGGGGGGGSFNNDDTASYKRYPGGNGGSGVCIIRWAEQ